MQYLEKDKIPASVQRLLGVFNVTHG